MKIFDSELRALFFDKIDQISNLRNELIFKKKNFLKSVNLNKTRVSYKFIKKNLKNAFITGLPFVSKNNLLKQHNYFKENFFSKKNLYCFLSVSVNRDSHDLYQKFLFHEQNYKFYKGIEILFDIHNDIINTDEIISFIKKCVSKNLIIKIWPVHCYKQLNFKPFLRGSINEVFYIISKINSPIILGGLGCGISNYFSYKNTNKILRKTYFSSSIPFSPENLKFLNNKLYKRVFFGSDYPFIKSKTFQNIISDQRKYLPKNKHNNVFNSNIQKFLKKYYT